MYELELYPNIRFGTFELDIIGNKEKLNDYPELFTEPKKNKKEAPAIVVL